MVREKSAQHAEGARVKVLSWMKKEPGFMARLFIRFVGVAMETGLAVYQPHWRGFMSRSWYQT
ncbi:antitermination protein Q [Escherichia coli ATCC BAA-2219]|nr:antitermination protein Q [Escherichia coli ATCC BAA-2219]